MLTKNELRTKVPAAFGLQSDKTSNRYTFVNTEHIVDRLARSGWYPVKANQVSSFKPETKLHGKHIIRFRNNTLDKIGDSFPELVLTNSHDAKSAFRFMLGVFRLVCSNGMVVCDKAFDSIRVTHVGYADRLVSEASERILQEAVGLATRIDKFSNKQLSAQQVMQFCSDAATLRWETPLVNPIMLNIPRRTEDAKTDLWTTVNRVQENLLKGGVPYTRTVTDKYGQPKQQQHRTKDIRSIDLQVKLNQRLWVLADKLAA